MQHLFRGLVPLIAALVTLCTSASPTASTLREESPRLRVVTLNVAKERDAAEMARQLNAAPRLRNPDFLLLQEVMQAPGKEASAADLLGAALGMHVAYAPAAPGVADQGLAILSRYPLRDVRITPLCRYDLLWRSRMRFALSATADTPAGPVRISNAHLDTRVNAAERIRQLSDALRDDHGNLAHIVAGDLNTNNFYWLWHALPLPYPGNQTTAVRRYMQERGFNAALADSRPTFDLLGMQLDHVFSKGLQTRSADVVPLRFSDHHALWVELSR